jgi:CDP-diacylglycerol--glycerol-3-phosphate 3-phosphatidyltransferase
MFFTLPNLMTWTRIAAIPLIVAVFYLPLAPELRNLTATVMFVVFALTDWLDGYLARKLNQTSSFGAFLDPVADKFLVCASLLVLVHLGRADVFVALIIIGRARMDGANWCLAQCGRAHAGQTQDHGADGGHSIFAV